MTNEQKNPQELSDEMFDSMIRIFRRYFDGKVINDDLHNEINNIIAPLLREARKEKWIEVDKELPPQFNYVLTREKDGTIDIAQFNLTKLKWYSRSDDWNDVALAVTHWMPLPSPPNT